MICMDVDTALAEVPVNTVPLTDDTDFKSLETAVAYNAAGMALYWHFVTTAGAYTATAVTPTTAGTYDWAHQQQGMYTIEIPASGGASINNDTEGFGYFTGVATGVLPWRGPTICFRASAINDSLVDAGTTGLLGPTTAGRTLDVSAGGEAGVDWANVGSPTTTLALTGTTIATTQKVDIETIKTRAVTCAAGVTVLASVGTAATSTAQTGDAYARLGAPAGASVSADVAAVKVDTAAILADTGTDGVVVAAGSKTGYSLTATTGLGNQTADITGSLSGSVGSVTGAVGSVTGAVGSVTTAVAVTSNVKKNQALSGYQFLMTDSTNHAPATGKTVTVTRSIDGAAYAGGTLSSVTEVSSGTYKVDFGAGDLNGNVVLLLATATGCDATFERIITQP